MSDAVHIDIQSHGLYATHNLMCWLCGENKAVYNMHPVWAFQPCGECDEAERVSQAGRIAELEAEIVRRQEAAEIIGALHAKVCNDVAEAVGVEVDPSGDADWAGIFELLAELGDRANITEAAVRRVRDVLTIGPLHRLDFPKYKDPYAIDRHVVAAAIDGVQPDRAALEGEQR